MRSIANAVNAASFRNVAVAGTPARQANAGTGASRLAVEPREIRLTPRELDVLALLGKGLPNKTIARTLDISTSTVKCHIANILSEFRVQSRLQAVVVALRDGLISDDAPLGRDPAQMPLMRVHPVLLSQELVAS